jgi:ribosome biogenesis GTPase
MDRIDSAIIGLGWDAGWASAFAPFAAAGPGRQPARVIAAHRDAWILASDAGDREATISGRLRHGAVRPGDLPAVGDWVAADLGDTAAPSSGPAVIHGVLPRRSAFRRGDDEGLTISEQVLAANIDIALVVTGLDGDFNLRRLERYLAVAWAGGTTPVIVLNKADAAADPQGQLLAAQAVAPGVDVRLIAALTGDGVASLAADYLRPTRTAVVLGSSGAGKSTLVNAIAGAELMRTGAVRAADARGRHTTTHRELLRLPGGALLVDTPGLRSLGVSGADEGLGATFSDVTDLAVGCRFGDCRHEREPGCAVRAALADGRLDAARMEAHRKLEREAAHAARSGDRLLREAEARRWKMIHLASREHMARKYGSDR